MTKLKAIIAAANKLINQVASFNIDIAYDAAEIVFYLVESSGYRFEISRASGFQKFLASAAFRLALCSGDFVFIDEGFGAADSKHISAIAAMLGNIAGDYKFLFVISHSAEIAGAITSPINITINGAVSSIIDESVVNADNGSGGGSIDSNVDIYKMIAPTVTKSTCEYKCVCGSVITNDIKCISAHNRTAKHKKFVASL